MRLTGQIEMRFAGQKNANTHLDFVIVLAKEQDHHLESIAKVFVDVFKSFPERREHYQRILDSGGTSQRLLFGFHYDLMTELVFCKIVDLYLTYIARLLAQIFKTKPQAMNPSERVELATILEYSTIEEVISALADQKVNSLAYKGMNDLASHLAVTLGLHLFESHADLKRAVYIIEIRNCLVHNDGVINYKAKKQSPFKPDQHGQRIELGQLSEDYSRFLFDSVVDIDARAGKKFDLIKSVDSSSIEIGPGYLADFEERHKPPGKKKSSSTKRQTN